MDLIFDNITPIGGVLLVKPSKESIKSFKKRMLIEWKKCFSWNNVNVHHITPIRCGGTDHINNLCLLHENCHRQVHSNSVQLIAAVCKLLKPYAK
ncbi:HNH endonuclease [Orientia tsutsugamushi]|uniref:HNH endonuclease n=1 Tax=Orientia tsutsugamushi TaxID=784 RepID=A0A2U3RM65_ORITS|nr:HNH endonuclease [Orientia tsutsugamushi]KJV55669.1 HNH endonuclease family protein [Orientia tsutsugamushi str. Karp]SPR14198.1 HNH endonuclease [Orientia tsutsugamushi]